MIDYPKTPDSTDSIGDHIQTLDSFEKEVNHEEEEVPASPHSYLSMQSCKQFPNMTTVEPLSRVLEPVMVLSVFLTIISNSFVFYIINLLNVENGFYLILNYRSSI